MRGKREADRSWRCNTGARVACSSLASLVLLLSACGPDGRQLRLCEQVFAEIEGAAPPGWRRVGAETLPNETPGVALLYRSPDGLQRFACRFKGGRFERGQSELIGVVRLSGEPLSFPALLHLRRRVGLH